MLGYRSLFNVEADGRDVTTEVLAQAHSWLRSKGYDADRLAVNADVALVAPHAQAVITSEASRDGSHSSLFSLREAHRDNGTWITQVVVHVPGRERDEAWVWIEVEKEGFEEIWAARPRLAKMILDVLPGDDHGARLTSQPTLVDADGVEHLVPVLMSRERRGQVFVAGSSDELPIQKWTTYISGLLGETVGLSAGYVLDGEATARLANIVGERHAVRPGTLRTYLPGLDPSSDLDSLRHRFLTTETILRTPAGRIRRSLGRRAREIALTTRVPRSAVRVESRLLAATDARVLQWRPTALVEDRGARLEGTQTGLRATEEPSVLAEPTGELKQPASAAAEVASDLAGLARELFDANLDGALLRRLAKERQDAVVVAAENVGLKSAAARAQGLNDRVLRLQRKLEEVRAEAQDALLEWALADAEVTERDRLIHTLRLRLMESGQAEAAWEEAAAPSQRDVAPESFAELLVRIETLEHVIFTGRPEPCDELDEKVPVGASGKAWNALLALDDYGRAKAAGEVSGAIHQYLMQPPAGYAGFSANRHAATESEDVQTNPKFRDARVFPVPKNIAAAGATFMGAHFKLAQLGMISPRLHYFDATSIDGRIYVGYIGPHLPTQMTS